MFDHLGDDASLVLGTKLGTYVGDPRDLCQCRSCTGVVASQHADINSLATQHANHYGHLRMQFIAHTDGPGDHAVDSDQNTGLPLSLQLFHLGFARSRVEPPGITHLHDSPRSEEHTSE